MGAVWDLLHHIERFDGFASLVLTLGCSSTRWWCGKSEQARCECLADRDAVAMGCSEEGESCTGLWQEERKRYISLPCWWLPDSKQTQHSLIQQRHVINEYNSPYPLHLEHKAFAYFPHFPTLPTIAPKLKNTLPQQPPPPNPLKSPPHHHPLSLDLNPAPPPPIPVRPLKPQRRLFLP